MEKEISKGERTRQMIIERAAVVFNEKGYAGTSISDLTKATKLTSGALYGSFANKESLAAAAFDYNVNKLLAGYRKCSKSSNKPAERLMNLIDFPYKEFVPIFQAGCPILNTATEADDTMPWMRNKVNKALGELKVILQDVLDEGVLTGDFLPIDTDKRSFYILSAFEGAIMIGKSMGDFSIIKDVTDQLKEDVKNSILNPNALVG